MYTEAENWEAHARAAALAANDLSRPIRSRNGMGALKGWSTKKGHSAESLFSILTRTHARFWQGTASERGNLIIIKQLEEYFDKDRPIDTVDTSAIDDPIATCIAKGNSNATINRKLTVLSKALRFAYNRNILKHMPRIECLSEINARFRWLTEEEEIALLTFLRKRGKNNHADVITVLLDTGMRPSEVYRIMPSDIDMEAETLSIWVTKTDRPRTVYMTSRVKEIFRRHINKGAQLFPYDIAWMRKEWNRAKAHMGLSTDPHFVSYICRHTCASRLVQRSVPINIVKEWLLGHSTIQMTMRYAFLAPTNLLIAAKALEKSQQT